MRCAECGEKLTGKPIRKGTRVFCSIDCAESAAEDRFDEDEDQSLEAEFDDLDDEDIELEADTEGRFYGDDDADDR